MRVSSVLACLFVFASVTLAGCVFQQSATPSPTQIEKETPKSEYPSLTQQEKDELMRIALSTQEAVAYRKDYPVYRTEMWWHVTMGFRPDLGPSGPFYKYDELAAKVKPTNLKKYLVNPTVLIRFGEPEGKLLRIVFYNPSGDLKLVQKLTRVREPVPEDSVLKLEVSGGWDNSHYLYITTGGMVIYFVEGSGHMGSLGPGVGEPTRTKSTGGIAPVHIERLEKLFQDPIFKVGEYKSEPKRADPMTRGKVSFSYRGTDARITTNYNPLTYDFVMNVDMPPVLKQVYMEISCIVRYNTREVSREFIAGQY